MLSRWFIKRSTKRLFYARVPPLSSCLLEARRGLWLFDTLLAPGFLWHFRSIRVALLHAIHRASTATLCSAGKHVVADAWSWQIDFGTSSAEHESWKLSEGNKRSGKQVIMRDQDPFLASAASADCCCIMLLVPLPVASK